MEIRPFWPTFWNGVAAWWDELATGALGAVVLADTRRLDGCFAAVDFFERRQIPFIVAVNNFFGQQLATLLEHLIARAAHQHARG